MSNSILTASMTTNLLNLKNTQKLMDITQNRLSTGKKVNSALDNPSNFFAATSLNNRAADLNGLLDNMGQSIQTLKSANEAISSITKLAEQAKSIASEAASNKASVVTSSGAIDFTGIATAGPTSNGKFDITVDGKAINVDLSAATDMDAVVTAINTALGAETPPVKTLTASDDSGKLVLTAKDGATHSIKAEITGLKIAGSADNAAIAAAQKNYNEILRQIDDIAKDAGYRGVNLLAEDEMNVIFNEDRSSNLNVEGVNASTLGLGLKVADFKTTTGIDAAISEVGAAISNLRSIASDFSNAYTIVQNREEFTENLINVIQEGSDKLTLADMNEEAANMLALQTKQQLGVQALSLASQASQGVLRLF